MLNVFLFFLFIIIAINPRIAETIANTAAKLLTIGTHDKTRASIPIIKAIIANAFDSFFFSIMFIFPNLAFNEVQDIARIFNYKSISTLTACPITAAGLSCVANWSLNSLLIDTSLKQSIS